MSKDLLVARLVTSAASPKMRSWAKSRSRISCSRDTDALAFVVRFLYCLIVWYINGRRAVF
eukprot:8372635-Pyramimonas_sp.AAC.1